MAAYLRSRGATKGLASKDEASLLCAAAEDGWVLVRARACVDVHLGPSDPEHSCATEAVCRVQQGLHT